MLFAMVMDGSGNGPGERALLWCAGYGLTVGNMITLGPLTVAREFAPERFARLVSLLVAANQLLYAFGPAAIGLLLGLTGDYRTPILICAAIQASAVLLVLSGRRRGLS